VTLNRQVLFWLAALAVLAAVLVLLSGMLLPFIAGLTVAYFLDPVANRLQRFGFSRLAATILILLLFVLLLVALGVIFIPVLIEQFGNFLDALPRIVQGLEDMVPPKIADWLRANLGASGGENGRPTLGQFASQGAAWLGTVLGSLWSGGQSLLSLVALVVLAPVIAFYMLLDWRRMITTVDSWIPLHQRKTIEGLAHEIDGAVAGFVRGQATVCVLLGAFYALGLSLVGLDFGLLIGLTAGILSFIPFVGSTTGFVLSVGVALVQFWNEWLMIGAVIGVFALGQFLEGNILQPRLVGRSVGLHPVWLMFALLAFTYLFGFVGALVAVPVSAAIGVLTRFALGQYLASPLYTGEARPTPVRSPGDGEKRAPGR
jgi:predicted PurR-regulated permease PerM